MPRAYSIWKNSQNWYSRGRAKPASPRSLIFTPGKAASRRVTRRTNESLIGDDLQQGIVAQTIGIIGVFGAGDDLIDALPQQRWRIVLHALFLTWVAEAFGPVPSQMMALIEGAQRQQTGVAGDLAAGKIGADELVTVEGEGQLW